MPPEELDVRAFVATFKSKQPASRIDERLSGRRQRERSHNRRYSQTLDDMRFRLRWTEHHTCVSLNWSCAVGCLPSAPNSVPNSLNLDHHDIGTPAKGGNS